MQKHAEITLPQPLPQYVPAGVIASLYQVTPAAVRFWASTGKIPSLKFQGTLRFDLAAVRSVIECPTEAVAGGKL